jgi:hypothetical protein
VEDHQEVVFQVSSKTYLVEVQDLAELSKLIITLVDHLAVVELIQVDLQTQQLEQVKVPVDLEMEQDLVKVRDKD